MHNGIGIRFSATVEALPVLAQGRHYTVYNNIVSCSEEDKPHFRAVVEGFEEAYHARA